MGVSEYRSVEVAVCGSCKCGGCGVRGLQRVGVAEWGGCGEGAVECGASEFRGCSLHGSQYVGVLVSEGRV